MIFALGVLVVGVALAALEWRRPDRRHRVRRVVATAMATGALAMLFRHDPGAASGGRTAVLVTADAVPGAVRRAADSTHGAVYVLPAAGPATRYGSSAVDIPDVGYLRRHHPETVAIVVAGAGLDAAELDALGAPAGFVRAPHAAGVVALRAPTDVRLGAAVEIRGAVAGAKTGDWIYLAGPDGSSDSTAIAGDSTFALTARPRGAGRFEYVVRMAGEDRTVIAETLGVAAVAGRLPRLLVLDGAPNFDTRYLKDWIGRSGGAAVVRTAVSRGRYRTVHLNDMTGDVTPLSAAVLGRFDAVVADTRALDALSGGERAALESAVRDRGAGLLLRADAAPSEALRGLLGGIALGAAPGPDERVSRLRWRGTLSEHAIPLTPFGLQPDEAADIPITDSIGRAVVEVRHVGAGIVAVTLASAPSRWDLVGEHDRFASYWSLVIDAVSRARPERWELAQPGPVLANAEMTFRRRGVTTATAALVETPAGSRDSVYLAQDRIDPALWTGRYWPHEPGWYRIIGDSASLDFNVRGPGAWRALQAAERERATTERLAAATRVTDAGRAGAVPFEMPAAIYFLIFLAAASVLWMERV